MLFDAASGKRPFDYPLAESRMSDSGYTDETYSTDYTTDATGETQSEEPQTTETKPEGEEEENEETAGEHGEEEQQTREVPPPEPEPDPLEGLTFEDDPEAELPNYGEVSYWEQRYTEDTEIFEWYQEPEEMLAKIKDYIDQEGKILVIGNGTSNLPVILNQNGYENVTAIDYSRQATKVMRRKNRDIEAITWRTMDVRKLGFEKGEFQAVLDKGTIDTLYQLGDSEVLNAMAEISRVVKRRGIFVSLSCAPPEARKQFFDRPADLLFELEAVVEMKKPLPSEEPHYLYVMRKVQKLMT